MLCDWCKKNEATIHIQEIVDGEKKAVHICGECASAKAQEQGKGILGLGPFNLAEMLYNLAAQKEAIDTAEDAQPVEGLVNQGLSSCPECHWSLEDLRKRGRLGCPHCYDYFRPIIAGVLPNMHRGKMHVGKQPGTEDPELCRDHARQRLELMNLQKELDEVIQREEYERAAELRDKIALLRRELHEGGPAHV